MADEARRYRKPNMAALEGEWGKRIFDTIKNSPRPDFEKMKKEAREYEEKILAAIEDGTY